MAGRMVWNNPADALLPCAGLSFPQTVENVGTNFNVGGLAFDGTTSEGGVLPFNIYGYTGGNPTATLDVYCDSGTTNAFVFDVALCAVTPDTDTQDAETDAFATAVSG